MQRRFGSFDRNSFIAWIMPAGASAVSNTGTASTGKVVRPDDGPFAGKNLVHQDAKGEHVRWLAKDPDLAVFRAPCSRAFPPSCSASLSFSPARATGLSRSP